MFLISVLFSLVSPYKFLYCNTNEFFLKVNTLSTDAHVGLDGFSLIAPVPL